MKACLAVPCFDHGETIGAVVEELAGHGLQGLVVDDGSGAETKRRLAAVAAAHPWIRVVRHAENRGRGAALKTAYREAARGGFTHVLQLDADGQHDSRDVPRFLAAAEAAPDALVLGEPVFDASAPRARLYGRKLSQGIVRAWTLSRAVHDPLCGFRCIPLAPTLRVLGEARLGDWMDFDPELVIRLVRAGVPVVNVPTRVRYFEGGTSHFHMVRDNLRIAWAYTRLAVEGLAEGLLRRGGARP